MYDYEKEASEKLQVAMTIITRVRKRDLVIIALTSFPVLQKPNSST
jgi:hypothetical protein